jgi:hypothetical protein
MGLFLPFPFAAFARYKGLTLTAKTATERGQTSPAVVICQLTLSLCCLRTPPLGFRPRGCAFVKVSRLTFTCTDFHVVKELLCGVAPTIL